MQKGTVSFFSDKGYGFVQSNTEEEPIFISRATVMKCLDQESLEKGQEITFTVAIKETGLRVAEDISLL